MEEIKKLNNRSRIIPLNPSFDCQVKHIPIKRAFDIIFSLTVLLAGLPVFLLIGLMIRCTSSGKAIFAHERIGRGGKPFRCYKFRTMYPNAEKLLKEILEKHPDLKEEWQKTFKLKKDPRITPIGAFLRKTSLDEIPQFWNVLKGDLSIVGPRPVIQEEVTQYLGVKAAKILSIRPGLTGPWQVSGRSDIDCYNKRIALDEYYIDNQSFFLDIKLVAKTIPAMLFSKGAY